MRQESEMIEAMKQALEALDCINSPLHMTELLSVGIAITALRAAIESQERAMKLRKDIAHHLALADGINAELAMQRLTDVQQEIEQWPVAYVTGYYDGHLIVSPIDHVVIPTGMALYTRPLRREWVGLTNDEIWEISQHIADDCEYVRAIEAKLKEKNCG